MKNVVKTDAFTSAVSLYKGVAISCSVSNSSYNEELWLEIDSLCAEFGSKYKVEDINKRETINATRQAYKALGKDPNRYRPSAEALCRRIIKEKSLYKINTLVDLINLISIKTGYSIGGFDEDKISGDTLVLDAGTKDDVLCGIGRGLLNIDGLPVFRDQEGGIGTPTSDNERTKLHEDSVKLLMIINGYSGEDGLRECVEYSKHLLKKYAEGENFEVSYF